MCVSRFFFLFYHVQWHKQRLKRTNEFHSELYPTHVITYDGNFPLRSKSSFWPNAARNSRQQPFGSWFFVLLLLLLIRAALAACAYARKTGRLSDRHKLTHFECKRFVAATQSQHLVSWSKSRLIPTYAMPINFIIANTEIQINHHHHFQVTQVQRAKNSIFRCTERTYALFYNISAIACNEQRQLTQMEGCVDGILKI